MPRNNKDRAKIALSQRHELAYLRTSARSILERLKTFKNSEILQIIRFDKQGSGKHTEIKQVTSVRKICKAFLKLSGKKNW